jgi:hypothetical protein
MTGEAPVPAALKPTDGSATGNLIGRLTAAHDHLETAHLGAAAAAHQADDAHRQAVSLGAARLIDGLQEIRDRIKQTQARLLATLAAAQQTLHTAQALLADDPDLADAPTAVAEQPPR